MTKISAIKILKLILSLLLCAVTVASALGATAVKGVRKYFSSDIFYNQIEETDLKTVTFVANGSKVTVSEYIHDCAKKYLEGKLPVFFPVADYAIDKVLSAEAIDSAVKEEALACVDFILNSDRDEAEKRIENGESILDSESLDPEKAENPTDAVKRYVRGFAVMNVEKNTGKSCDKIIVLLSEKTATKLTLFSVVSALILLVLNFKTVFNVLLYSGIGAFLYGAVIKVLQGKFNGAAEGNEDLIGFYILTPLVETFSSNAVWAFAVGAVSIAVFIGMYFVFKNYVNKQDI